jgi:hypothetical protein
MSSSRNRPQRVAAAVLRRQSMELRIAGHSYAEIAVAIGRTAARAHQLVKEGMAENSRELKVLAAEETARQLSICDRLLQVCLPMATAGDAGAADSVLRILQRRAKLTGVDFAFRHDAEPAQPGPQVLIVAPDEPESAEAWAQQYAPKPELPKADEPH